MHMAFGVISIPKEVNPNTVDFYQYYLDWFMWYKRIQMRCQECNYTHQGEVYLSDRNVRMIREFPKVCPKCGKKPLWKGRYEDKLGHNLIAREMKFYEFAVPEETKDLFLQDMRTWVGEAYDCDRYGQRFRIDSAIKKAYKYGKMFLPKKNVLTPIDMDKYKMTDWNRKEKDMILNDGVFNNVYPIFAFKDGFVVGSKTKREII